jgi:phosphocarrier protein HPr
MSLSKSEFPSVSKRVAKVRDPLGIHLRSASRFVEVARRFVAEIRVRLNGADANGKSILDLVCLAAECGSVLELEAHGCDSEEAVAALADLIAVSSR